MTFRPKYSRRQFALIADCLEKGIYHYDGRIRAEIQDIIDNIDKHEFPLRTKPRISKQVEGK